MRPRRDLMPSKSAPDVQDEVGAARRYRWLCRWLLTGDAVPVADRVRAELQRIEKGKAGAVSRLERLERFLADEGVLDDATAFADRIDERSCSWRAR